MDAKESVQKLSTNPIVIFRNLFMATIVCPIIGAWLHAYALWYIPIVFLKIVAIAFIAFGMVPIKFLYDYKIIRDNTLLTILGLCFALFTYYLSWAIWLSLAQNIEGTSSFLILSFPITHANYGEIFRLFLNPAPLYNMMLNVGNIGTWGIRGSVLSGFPLFVVWIIEFLIVIFMAVKMTKDLMKIQ
jgi:hypothetical protein